MQAVYQNLYIYLYIYIYTHIYIYILYVCAIWRSLTLLFSTALDHTNTSSGKASDVGLESSTATVAGVLMFTCPFSVIPYWTFYVLLLRKAVGMHLRSSSLRTYFITSFIKTCFRITIIYYRYYYFIGSGECSRYSDWLRAGRSENLIPVGARFSRTCPDRPQVPQWVHGLFPGGKAAGSWRWPPTPSTAEVQERVELYLYSPLVLCGLF
jgi:hypothetical protein